MVKVRREGALPVVGMDELGPEGRIAAPLLRGVAEDPLELRADVDGGPGTLAGVVLDVDVRRRRDLLDEPSVAVARLDDVVVPPLPLDRGADQVGRGSERIELVAAPRRRGAPKLEPPPRGSVDGDLDGGRRGRSSVRRSGTRRPPPSEPGPLGVPGAFDRGDLAGSGGAPSSSSTSGSASVQSAAAMSWRAALTTAPRSSEASGRA